MKKFFHSQLYANFWKFSIYAPLMSGLLTIILGLIFYFSLADSAQLNDLPHIIGAIGFVAVCATFIPALVGFWIVWFVARKQIVSFAAVSIVTGLILGLIVVFCFSNPDQLFLSKDKSLMLVMDLTLLGSVFIFYKLSKKYIEPVL